MAGLRSRVRTALLLAAAALSGRPAAGADIQVAPGANGVPLVFVSGRMVPEDVAAFAGATARLAGGAAVVLDSPGGSAVAGIEIDRLIRQRGLATLVPEGARCASACALAWLGGATRYIWCRARPWASTPPTRSWRGRPQPPGWGTP